MLVPEYYTSRLCACAIHVVSPSVVGIAQSHQVVEVIRPALRTQPAVMYVQATGAGNLESEPDAVSTTATITEKHAVMHEGFHRPPSRRLALQRRTLHR